MHAFTQRFTKGLYTVQNIYTCGINLHTVPKVITMKRERLPKGSIEVIDLLGDKGALTQKEIIDSLKETKPRAIRYTVRQLLERTVLVNRANFEDMRSSLIGLNPEMDNNLKDLITLSKERVIALA